MLVACRKCRTPAEKEMERIIVAVSHVWWLTWTSGSCWWWRSCTGRSTAAAACPSGAPPCRRWPPLCTCTHSRLQSDHLVDHLVDFSPRKRLPDEETVHLLQTQLQNLLLEVPIDLGSNLKVLLKHLKSRRHMWHMWGHEGHFQQRPAGGSSCMIDGDSGFNYS